MTKIYHSNYITRKVCLVCGRHLQIGRMIIVMKSLIFMRKRDKKEIQIRKLRSFFQSFSSISENLNSWNNSRDLPIAYVRKKLRMIWRNFLNSLRTAIVSLINFCCLVSLYTLWFHSNHGVLCCSSEDPPAHWLYFWMCSWFTKGRVHRQVVV